MKENSNSKGEKMRENSSEKGILCKNVNFLCVKKPFIANGSNAV